MSWAPPLFAVLKWRWMRDGTCGHCGRPLGVGSGTACPCPIRHQRHNRTRAPIHPPHDVCDGCRYGSRPVTEHVTENLEAYA
jgi:hypothetical protein